MQIITNKKLTLCQALRLVQDTEKLFNAAAHAVEQGHNSGKNAEMIRCQNRCDKLRIKAEAALAPLGITCDYPGLYPSFTVKGFTEHSVLNAVSAALEDAQ